MDEQKATANADTVQIQQTAEHDSSYNNFLIKLKVF